MGDWSNRVLAAFVILHSCNASKCTAFPNQGVTNGGDVERATKQPTAEACITRCESTSRCCVGLWNSADGMCYLKYAGELIPPVRPSATAFNCTGCAAAPTPPPTPCKDDWDCSLAGSCTGGACVCDPWTTGTNCSVLNLAPADPNNGLQLPGYHSW
jgi:hypothetical protein